MTNGEGCGLGAGTGNGQALIERARMILGPRVAGHPEPSPDPDIERARLEADRISRLKAMNVGEIYWDENFGTFEAHTPELERHLETARAFAANPKGKLVMLGENGAGKTHLAASILQVTGGVIYTAYDIGVRLRKCFNGDGREWEMLDELCHAPVLVIDEIGRTKGSKPELDWLSHMINRRHENFRPVVFISNCHMSEDCAIKGGCTGCFENYFNDDVTSRILENGVFMEFAGGDYRLKIRERGRR